MSYYENLSQEITAKMTEEKKNNTFKDFSFKDEFSIRRKTDTHDGANIWRTAFIRDIDKIMHCPFFNRYSDKTQVMSFYKNDDLSHRSLHVQLVSRIARTLGKALNLNLDLIEAIALGHDIGHTPFGHTGEKFINQIYFENTGRYFNHNIHSIRVLDVLFPLNLCLQTLDGIAAHNGELELSEYSPIKLNSFKEFDEQIELCYVKKDYTLKLIPSTLEGCVVRLSDIIAYLGKDRQDAENNNLISYSQFKNYGIGTMNAEILNNLMVNVIENSYGKPYIKMDEKHFNALSQAKKDNYTLIYKNNQIKKADQTISDMLKLTYDKLFNDLIKLDYSSPVYTHHIKYLNKPHLVDRRANKYEDSEPNQIIVDYIASMTDDYFIELFNHLFPSSTLSVKYEGYFD